MLTYFYTLEDLQRFLFHQRREGGFNQNEVFFSATETGQSFQNGDIN